MVARWSFERDGFRGEEMGRCRFDAEEERRHLCGLAPLGTGEQRRALGAVVTGDGKCWRCLGARGRRRPCVEVGWSWATSAVWAQ
jgi:hypothetical protein